MTHEEALTELTDAVDAAQNYGYDGGPGNTGGRSRAALEHVRSRLAAAAPADVPRLAESTGLAPSIAEALRQLKHAVDATDPADYPAAHERWSGALNHVRERLFEQQLRGADRPFDVHFTLKAGSESIANLLSTFGTVAPFYTTLANGEPLGERQVRLFRVEHLPNGDVSFWFERYRWESALDERVKPLRKRDP